MVGKEAEGELRRFFVDVPHLVLAQANVGIRWCGAMLGIGCHVVGYDRRPSRLLPQPCAARSLHLLISVISSLYPMTVIVTVRHPLFT